MKKVLCFMLAFLLAFNTAAVYADIGGSFISPTPTPAGGMLWWDDKDWEAFNNFQKFNNDDDLLHKFNDFIIRGITGSDAASKVFGETAANGLGTLLHELANLGDLRTDGDNVYMSQNAADQINVYLQDKVHALDGYYLFDAEYSKSDVSNMANYYNRLSDNDKTLLSNFLSSHSVVWADSDITQNNPFWLSGINDSDYLYIKDGYVCLYPPLLSNNEKACEGFQFYVDISRGGSFCKVSNVSLGQSKYYTKSNAYVFGSPLKLFYSKQDLDNYLNKGRTYVSKLPSHIIRIPVSVVNNTPQITYNITTENKTENEIQNEYNQYFEDYITNLYPSSGSPSPTPTPGDGGFSDGTTPTPTPPLSDGSLTPTPVPGSGVDMTETNNWLQKIYELLQKFYDSYSEFTKKISDSLENNDAFFKKVSEYLETHDRKLDEIVDAIDKLSQGKEEGEEKGCKYDYTELSGFMTKLWNDSDQKFDTMIDLLKENNAYQEKLVSTLNSIKNILKAQSIMDSFKNRSQETANKAKDKFPTSVPWDVAMVVNAMSADPKEPVFVLPVKITRLGIDEEIKIDLSTGEWEKLAKACRYMLSLLFILFMVKLTIKLFGGKGDD